LRERVSINILHVIPSVAPRYGGPSAAILQECLALGALGTGTLIATTDADGDERLPVPLDTVTTYGAVRTRFFSRAWSEAFKYSPQFARWMRRHARDFDVVHIRGVLSHVCLAAASACRTAHVPYVMEPLGTLDRWSLAQKPWRKRMLLGAGGRRALRGAEAIRCTSTEEKRQVESLLGVQTGLVIPLAIDARPIAASSDAVTRRDQDRYVLVLSRLHPVKGLHLLIDAFATAIASDRGAARWRLVIAGNGDPEYVHKLRTHAAASPVADRIVFEGWVDGPRKAALLDGASLFALPSHHENFGMSLAEALACGVPAIVSRYVQLADTVVASGSGWVSALTLEAVSNTLREAMFADGQLATKSQAARSLGQTFSSTRVAQQLVELYEHMRPHPALASSPMATAMTGVK
jgi:glycosyltransferase involved in cell wall biosynthesis